MYKNINAYELKSIQFNLNVLLNHKLFEMDKDRINFLEKKLNLNKALKLYLRKSNKFEEFYKYHLLMLEYLQKNDLLRLHDVSFIHKRIDAIKCEILDDDFYGYPPIYGLMYFLDYFSGTILEERNRENINFTTLSYLTTKDCSLTTLHKEFTTATNFLMYYYDEFVEIEDSEWMYRELFDDGVVIKIKNFTHPLRDIIVRSFNLNNSFSLANSSAYISNNDLYVCILETDIYLGLEILLLIVTIINFGGNNEKNNN